MPSELSTKEVRLGNDGPLIVGIETPTIIGRVASSFPHLGRRCAIWYANVRWSRRVSSGNGGVHLSLSNSDQLVIEDVRRHYNNSQTPYYLSALGKFFQDHEIEIPSGVRFKDYVKSRFSGQLSVIQNADVPAKIAVATSEVEDRVRQQLTAILPETPVSTKIDFGRLPNSLISAFCVRRTPGSGIYFRIARPFRYAMGSAAPDNTYVAIDDAFRPSHLEGTLYRNLLDEDKRTIHESIEGWAKAMNIDLRTIYFDANSGSFGREPMAATATANALQRLVEAQAPALRHRIMIPGDIAVTLIRLP